MINQQNDNHAAAENGKRFQKAKRIVSALVIAVVIWFLIVNVVNPRITVSVPDVRVTFVGEGYLRSRGYVIVDRDKLPDFSLRVSGTRSELINGLDRIYAEIDVTGIEKAGNISVAVTVNAPGYISIEKQKISSVELTVEPCYEKTVPVVIVQEGDDKKRTEGKIVRSVPESDEVTVVGSASDLEAVEGFVALVDVSQVHEDGRSMYSCYLADAYNKPVPAGSSAYCASSTVAVNNVIYDRHTVAVDVEVKPSLKQEYRVDYDVKNLSMATVDVGVLPGDEVPDRLTAVISNEQGLTGENVIELMPEAEAGVYIPDTELALRVKFVPLKKKKITVIAELKKIPDGLTAEKSEISLEMMVILPEDVTEQVRGKIDCTGFVPGENTGKIEFYDEYITPAEPKTIIVNLKEKTQ